MSTYNNFLPRLSDSDFNYEQAYRAHYWSSMNPTKRAKNDIAGIVVHLNQIADEFEGLVKSDEQKSRAIAEFSKFIEGYKKYNTTLWLAKSKTASTMVTGGSNFNVSRNQKALNVENKRLNEFIDWEAKAQKRAKANINGAAPEDVKSEERWNSIKKEVISHLATVLDIEKNRAPYSKPLITGALKRILLKVHKQGFQVEFNKAMDLIKETQDKQGITVFAKNNPIWTLAATPTESNPIENKTKETIYSTKGLEVVRYFQEDRVRMYFDGKPDLETISLLKKNAFKWSPYNKAWQRQNTENGVKVALMLAEKFFPKIKTSTRRKLSAPAKTKTAKRPVKAPAKKTSSRRKLAKPAAKPKQTPKTATRKNISRPKKVNKIITQNERLKRAARALVRPTGVKLDGTLKKGYTRTKNGDVVKQSLIKKCPAKAPVKLKTAKKK